MAVVAMGHPLGATGAMIVGTLLDEMERSDKETGLATLCVASGMGANGSGWPKAPRKEAEDVSTPNSNEALRLYQELLDRLSTAVLAGDLDTVSGCFSLPTRSTRSRPRSPSKRTRNCGKAIANWAQTRTPAGQPTLLAGEDGALGQPELHRSLSCDPCVEKLTAPHGALPCAGHGSFDGENYMNDEVEDPAENT